MPEAPETIRALLGSIAPPGSPSDPRIVGITGPVGAGKSTLASRLSRCVIATDHYLPDYETTPEHLRDLPERSDLTRLLADLSSLRAGRPTRIPLWTHESHSRVGEMLVTPHEMIVVEGLHALHATHAHVLDLRVYVDAEPGDRWSRWEQLERSGVRTWGVEYARKFFDRVAEPTFARYEHAYRQIADVIVVNPGSALTAESVESPNEKPGRTK